MEIINDSIVIIPDIHGEGFWKSALRALPESLLVFLGDYLDPINDENTTPDDAYFNLIDIVNLKKKYPNNVVLLWGNHDLHYLYHNLIGSRYDYDNSERFFQFFWQNQDCFQLAYDVLINGRTYLFTHAGVGRKWAERINKRYSSTIPTAVELNNMFQGRLFIDALGAKTSRRGGWSDFGSIIWADVHEHLIVENQYKDIIQIFGHSRCREPLNVDGSIFCLDCQRCFKINRDNGLVKDLISGISVSRITDYQS